MKNRTKEIKKLLPDWSEQNQFFDLRICPDCNTIQVMKSMHEGSRCDNPDCESIVVVYTGKSKKNYGKLMWDNTNWY